MVVIILKSNYPHECLYYFSNHLPTRFIATFFLGYMTDPNTLRKSALQISSMRQCHFVGPRKCKFKEVNSTLWIDLCPDLWLALTLLAFILSGIGFSPKMFGQYMLESQIHDRVFSVRTIILVFLIGFCIVGLFILFISLLCFYLFFLFGSKSLKVTLVELDNIQIF